MTTTLNQFRSPEDVVRLLVDNELWTSQLDPDDWESYSFADMSPNALLSELLDQEGDRVLEMADLFFTDVAEFLNGLQDAVIFAFEDGVMTAEVDGRTIEQSYDEPEALDSDEAELEVFGAQLALAAPIFHEHCELRLWLAVADRAVFAAEADVVAALAEAMGIPAAE